MIGAENGGSCSWAFRSQRITKMPHLLLTYTACFDSFSARHFTELAFYFGGRSRFSSPKIRVANSPCHDPWIGPGKTSFSETEMLPRIIVSEPFSFGTA